MILCDLNPIRHIGKPWVTWSLAAACVILSVLYWAGAIPEHWVVLVRADPYTSAAVGHLFAHGGIMHLVGNLLPMLVFADNVEDAMGRWTFAAFVIGTGLIAAAGQLLLAPGTEALVGASGWVAAVMGSYLVLHPRAQVGLATKLGVLFVPAGFVVGMFVIQNIVAVLAGTRANVAWWAHICGFLAGIALTPILKHPDVPLFQPPRTIREIGPELGEIHRFLAGLDWRDGSFLNDRAGLASVLHRGFWWNAAAFVALMLLGGILL